MISTGTRDPGLILLRDQSCAKRLAGHGPTPSLKRRKSSGWRWRPENAASESVFLEHTEPGNVIL